MVTSVSSGPVELRQSAANALQMPILIAVVVAAIAIGQVFSHRLSAGVFVFCGVLAVLDLVFVRYVLRDTLALMVVSADEITFTRRRAKPRKASPTQTIRRAPGSTLTFRMAANGPLGSDHTGYVLKLRDETTGDEVYAGAFGRNRVQQACESQGWTFS